MTDAKIPETASWQPIETAPAGEILLFYPRHAAGIRIGYWWDGDWRVGLDMDGAKPTHWATLPEPPADSDYWPALPMPGEPRALPPTTSGDT